MNIKKSTLRDTGAFSDMFLDYVEDNAKLEPFYQFKPEISSFHDAISQRNFTQEKRLKLFEVINEEYGALPKSEKVTQNIFALKDEKTFTVTTGHQLNIFTGPLYFIFKIVTTINLAKKLKEAYPDYHFVPVYWMASEDHDFEEIRSFNLFGNRYTWETSQTGAVGRFAPQSLNELLEAIPEKIKLFEKAYLDSTTLADAARVYCNELFGEEGLIVVDADDRRLKSLFADVIKKDILENKTRELVSKTNDELAAKGYKSQAFSRDINFFFLNGFRERIIKANDSFRVNNHDLSYSRDELINLIDESPERFSPNVILRPLYQETILPNLGYIGGPAEIVYWLQLIDIFHYYHVPFPVLMPRNFGVVINRGLTRKIDKIGCDHSDIFKEDHVLKKEYIERNSNNEHLLDGEKENLEKIFQHIKTKAASIDKSLEGFVGAESTKTIKNLENIEKRLKKAQENQNDTAMKQIDSVKEKLFPGGGLQERHDNFLNFSMHNPNFIKDLLEHFDPFDFAFYQFWEE